MLVIRLFGGLAIELEGREVAVPRRRHGGLLLAYLALFPGEHARADLAALLWPDVLDSSARTSLRSALHSIRRALGRDAARYLLASRDSLGLAHGDEVWVDALAVDQLIREGEPERALALAKAELLQGLEAEWVDAARQRYLALADQTLSALAGEAQRAGDLEAALRHARRRVALDPLAEPANRELMRLLSEQGDRASALSVYARLCERYRRELRITPSHETRALAERVRTSGRSAAVGREDHARLPPLPAVVTARRSAPMLARDEEMAVLRRCLRAALEGRLSVGLVGGEPGIGKTRLAAELAAEAHDAGITVLFATCLSGAGESFCQPVLEALRAYLRASSSARLRPELPGSAGELRGLLPELEDEDLELPPPLTGPAEGESGRVTRALIETLLAIASAGSLLLVVDDLHAADPGTLGLLEQLAHRSHGRPLAIVATYRDPDPTARVAPTLRRLRRLEASSAMRLEGLAEPAVAALARTRAGAVPPPGWARSLHESTQGNPLFVQELLGRAFARRRSPDAAWPDVETVVVSPLPERVSDLILEDLMRLSELAQEVLGVAAVAGDRFAFDVIVEASMCSRRDTLNALDEAVLAGVVHEIADGVGDYEFRHPLLREVAYGRITNTRRAELHRRVGLALEAREGGDASAGEIAAHFLRAGKLVPSSKLVEVTFRAGETAERAHAHEHAAALYAQALEATRRSAGADATRRCQLLIALGHARRRAAQVDSVRDVFLEAAAIARRADQPALLGESALGVCTVPYFPGDAVVDDTAVNGLREALDRLQDTDEGLRARLLAQLARERYFVDEQHEIDGVATEALALARRSGDLRALAAALDTLHLAFAGAGDPRHRVGLAEEMIALGSAAGSAELGLRGRVLRGVDLLELGEVDQALAVGEELDLLAVKQRQPAYRWWPALWRAGHDVYADRLDEGEQLIESAFALGHAPFGEAAELEHRAQLYWLAGRQGRGAQNAAELSQVASHYSALPALRCAAALAAAEAGHRQSALAILQDLTRHGLARLQRDSGWLISATLLCQACLRLAEVPLATSLHQALKPFEDRHAVSSHGSVWLGPVADQLSALESFLSTGPAAPQPALL